MGDTGPQPRLVPRAESSARAGASHARLRLVGVPNLRTGARGHYLRHPAPPAHPPRPHEPILVGPPPAARVVAPPSRELRLLCCEGSCSPGLTKFYDTLPTLYQARFTGTTVRANESNVLSHTAHYFVRTTRMGATEFHTWACTVCGNERIYGAEEP